EADVAADKLIASELGAHFPSDAILSEELAPTSAGENASRSAYTWIVDPLDGTTNFSLGVQHWGVSIARSGSSGPDVGVLYFPALGEMYVSARGSGATMNGVPIHVRGAADARLVGMLACCARTPRHYHVNLPMKVRVFGSAARNRAKQKRCLPACRASCVRGRASDRSEAKGGKTAHACCGPARETQRSQNGEAKPSSCQRAGQAAARRARHDRCLSCGAFSGT